MCKSKAGVSKLRKRAEPHARGDISKNGYSVEYTLFLFNRIFILDETLQLIRLAVINVCPVLLPPE